jgi:sRNA-binding protein
MFVSEDGTVTGSIDASKLDEVEAKTDEAKAQLAALKAERDAGQKLADADADRVAEVHAAQAAQLTGTPDKAEAPKAPAPKSTSKSASSSDKG